MEDGLAGDVAELQATRERRAPGGARPGSSSARSRASRRSRPPTPTYFFGRERLVAELVARLVGAPLLGVVGPSGSGKSSVAAGGPAAGAREGLLPGSERWPLVLIRPGEHPLRELERATRGDRAGRARRRPVRGDCSRPATTSRSAAAFIARLVAASRSADGASWSSRSAPTSTAAAPPTRARAAARGQPRAGRPDEPRRAPLASSSARRARRPRVEPELADALVADVEDGRARSRCSRPRCSSSGSGATGRACGRDLRGTGGVPARSAARPRTPTGGSTPPSRPSRDASCCGSAEVEPEGGVERRRVPLAELEASRRRRSRGVIEQLADAPAADGQRRHASSSPTRR